MRVLPTDLTDARIVVSDPFEDHRGFFKETFRANRFAEFGITTEFVQDNISRSTKSVLRGMHYDFDVAKLVQVVYGQTYHVIADMRPGSPTYCKWQSFILSHENHKQIYVPPGFANGFYVLSDMAFVYYKQGTYFSQAGERQLRWNDPAVDVRWPSDAPILSEKDRNVPDYRPERARV